MGGQLRKRALSSFTGDGLAVIEAGRYSSWADLKAEITAAMKKRDYWAIFGLKPGEKAKLNAAARLRFPVFHVDKHPEWSPELKEFASRVLQAIREIRDHLLESAK